MKLKRDQKLLRSILFEKDNKLFTKEPIKIQLPQRYIDKNLANIGQETQVYGIFSIIYKDNYSVSRIPALFTTTPITITTQVINDVDYINFNYGKNCEVISNLNVVKNKILTETIFQEFFVMGKTPWFIEYEDVIEIFNNMVTYAASDIGKNHIATELITSYIARQKDDIKKYHRTNINSQYVFAPLDDVFYSANSTLSKLAGNYFSDGIISALRQPEKQPTTLEQLVKA